MSKPDGGGGSSSTNSMEEPAASPGSSNAAARLRRSISAARAAKAAEADDPAEPLGLQYDDSSLVLYGDPSRLSTRSRGSVMSGAHEQGETFFTALKRQPSWQSDTGSEAYTQAVGSKAGSLCCPDSQVNPVQSVSNSAFFSAAVADDDGDGDDGSLLEAGQEELSGFGASKESSYASMLQDGNTPASPSDPLSDGQLASSVLNIIDSLYGGTAAAASSSHAWQQQQQLSLQDQPLREMLVVAAPQHAAASEAEQAAAEAAPPGIPDTAGSQAAGQLQQVCSNVCRPDSPGSLSTDEEAGGAADVQAADPEQHEQRQQEESADTAADEPSAAGGDSRASSDATSSADGKALLASMDGLLAERSKLQQELSGYLQQLGSQEDGEGEPLVLLAGQAYALLVERLLREGRAQQYRALHGWEGPHRFEDLPVAQLATSHKDPEVAAGLAAIAKLDAQLQEANLKALLSARALNPDQWADAEKRRLERRAAELDAALSKERHRRAHAAKLRCALGRLDTERSRALLLGGGSNSFSYYRLKPQEEELLASVLALDDAALEADNPFDPMLLRLETEDNSTDPDDAATCRTADTEQQSIQGRAQSEQSRQVLLTAVACTAAGVQGPMSAPGMPSDSAWDLRAGAGSAALSSRLSSCLSGTVFSLMRASSGHKGRRCSLAEIDAQLEAMQAEREVAAQLQAGRTGGQPLSTKTSSSKSSGKACARTLLSQASTASTASFIPLSPAATVPGSSLPSRSHSFTGASRIPLAPAPAPAAAVAPGPATTNAVTVTLISNGGSSWQPRVSACWGVGSVGVAHQGSLSGCGRTSRRGSSAASSDGSGRSGGSSSSTVRTIDYLREQREVKELAQREVELDAQLRALQTSELLPGRLTAQQLQMLLQAAY